MAGEKGSESKRDVSRKGREREGEKSKRPKRINARMQEGE